MLSRRFGAALATASFFAALAFSLRPRPPAHGGTPPLDDQGGSPSSPAADAGGDDRAEGADPIGPEPGDPETSELPAAPGRGLDPATSPAPAPRQAPPAMPDPRPPAVIPRESVRAISGEISGARSRVATAKAAADAIRSLVTSGAPERIADAPPPPGTGLLGEYWKLVDQVLLDYPSVTGLEPAIRRIDARVEFRDGASFRFPFLARNFAARWRGFIYAAEDGEYGLTLGADDGGWLSVDGASIVSIPGLHPYAERSARTFLARGFHTIEVRMFQNEGDVAAVLAWAPPGGPPGVVPQESLYPPEALTPAQAPRITNVTPLRARWGQPIEIDGEGLPEEGLAPFASFDGVPMTARSLGKGRLGATLPPGVDRGDIVVGDSGAPSQGFPYEAGDNFGLLGEYIQQDGEIRTFDDMPAPGPPGAVRRIDAVLAFPSGGAFALPFPPRRFCTRWTGQLYVANGGPHTFRLTSDDGSRLLVDQALLVDDGGLHPMQASVGARDLAQGFHDIEVDFFQNEGDVGLVLEWVPPGSSGFAIVPRRALYAPPALALRDPPVIVEIVPASAAPGDRVEVRGRGFTGSPASDRVTFAQGAAAPVESSSPTCLVVHVPAAAQSGPVVVQSGELSAAPVRFDVLGRGLTAAYYQLEGPISSFPSLAGRAPALVRVDPVINFGEDVAFNLPFPPDHFAAVYTGSLAAPVDGHYRFALGSDDGSRLFVDGTKVVDLDGLHTYFVREGDADLAAGRHAIRIEFFENEGIAVLRLGWLVPGQSWATLPQSALYPDGAN